jgi:hypothetical protein
VLESRLLKAAERLSSKAVWAKPVCSKRKEKQRAREMSLKRGFCLKLLILL